ncbi:V-set domain containing T-cell activation inhibitor 1 [Oreochromis niloticus]|uniref:V-set domain containing T-cell activation inhibitor 1 n=1 Tax=Oreochromis niloticus TaxID=8128 RepID=UPI0009050740|nr:V-set domain containing T-cell activation inhibitor 1 [Oreochromis niloticus]
MERARLLSHCWALLFLHSSLTAAADLVNITAESGQNVTLSCRTNNNNPITFLEWSKYGLKKGYLLLYRDEWFDLENQHPLFKNRVDLQDRQMKDGDVSVILKNVTINDAETYMCHVQKDGDSMKRISIIYLSVVDPPGQPGGGREDGGKEETGE